MDETLILSKLDEIFQSVLVLYDGKEDMIMLYELTERLW